MRPRRNRPLFIIDIAMPRDVEAAAGEIEQVFLYNIDDLQATVRENLARRASEVARAEAIVGEEVEKFGALAALARRHPDRRRAAPAVRGDPARRARAARLQAVVAAARGARARRRNHAADRREAAADADRAAEGARRRGDGRRLLRGADPAVRARRPARPTSRRSATGRRRAAASSRSSARPADAGSRPTRITAWMTAQELRLGTRGSQLALWQAQHRRGAHRRSRRPAVPRSSSSRRPAIGCRTRRCRRSAASGCSSRKSKTRCSAARSTSRCTAARTCRRCCRTG